LRILLALIILAVALAPYPGCAMGLSYEGDERGLRRDETRSSAGRLSYLAAGDHDAPRIIFIHGSPGKAAAYVDYLQDPRLARFEAIAVDRLGYGESSASGPVMSFRRQAAAIAPLLEVRQGQRPILVGHSLGVPIAARLAADNPDLVGGLILIAGPLDPGLEQPRWYNAAAGLPPVSGILAGKLRVSNREMFAARRQLRLLGPLLERITCPVTVVHGTADRLVPFGHLEYAARALGSSRDLRVVEIEGEDHFIPRTRPELVSDLVLEMRRRARR
jgi:pimeloyl-ACP methyl ester carboxylesterase